MSTTTPIKIIPQHPAEVVKAILYIAVQALGLIQLASAAGPVTLPVDLMIAVSVLGLIPVYLLSGTWAKAGTALGVAVLQTLSALFVGGYHPLNSADLVVIALSALSALGIVYVPNALPLKAAAASAVNITLPAAPVSAGTVPAVPTVPAVAAAPAAPGAPPII